MFVMLVYFNIVIIFNIENVPFRSLHVSVGIFDCTFISSYYFASVGEAFHLPLTRAVSGVPLPYYGLVLLLLCLYLK